MFHGRIDSCIYEACITIDVLFYIQSDFKAAHNSLSRLISIEINDPLFNLYFQPQYASSPSIISGRHGAGGLCAGTGIPGPAEERLRGRSNKPQASQTEPAGKAGRQASAAAIPATGNSNTHLPLPQF